MEYFGVAAKEFGGIFAIAILSAFISIAEAGATKSLKERIRHPRRYDDIDIYSFSPLKRAFSLTLLAGMLYSIMTDFTMEKATFVIITATNARTLMDCVFAILELFERFVGQLFMP